MRAPRFIGGLVLGLVLGVAAVAGLARRTDAHAAPSVVLAVRHLSRLETVEFHMEKVIPMVDDQHHGPFGLIHGQDTIEMLIVANVVAGVDLAGLQPQDVVVDAAHHRVTLRLPAPTVFSVTADDANTHVLNRQVGLLALRNDDLERRTRAAASATLRQAALDGGILEHARAVAELDVRALMLDLGFESASVTWR